MGAAMPSCCLAGASAVAALVRLPSRAIRSGGFIAATPPCLHVLADLYRRDAGYSVLVISITMVVLTLAAQSLGPRLIPIFMGDTRTKLTLGIFIGTATYLLIVLRTVAAGSDNVPQLAVTLGTSLVLASVIILLFFVHHLARSIVANTIIARVGTTLNKYAATLLPAKTDHATADYPELAESTAKGRPCRGNERRLHPVHRYRLARGYRRGSRRRILRRPFAPARSSSPATRSPGSSHLQSPTRRCDRHWCLPLRSATSARPCRTSNIRCGSWSRSRSVRCRLASTIPTPPAPSSTASPNHLLIMMQRGALPLSPSQFRRHYPPPDADRDLRRHSRRRVQRDPAGRRAAARDTHPSHPPPWAIARPRQPPSRRRV